MEPLSAGFLLGASISILIGPLLFTLLEASLSQGLRAGFAVAAGFWISDLLFIGGVYYSFSLLKQILAWPYFELAVGIAGGIVLIAIGLGLWWASYRPAGPPSPLGTRDLGMWWVKGFLVNTLNAFSVFFWFSMMTGFIVPRGWSGAEAVLFFGAIMGTIVLTDSLKVLLARRIRNLLQERHITLVRRISGVILFGFGVALCLRGVL